MKKKESILIIGGTGFIGSNFILKYKNKYNITSLSKNPINYHKIEGVTYFDMINFLGYSNKSYDYIISCFGTIDHSDYFNEGKNFLREYINSFIDIIDILDLKKIKKLIHIGSADEYGISNIPINENAQENPLSAYGVSRLTVTNLLRMISRSYSIPIVVLRIFLPYGPGQGGKKIIPHIIKNCLLEKKFHLSSGLQNKDFCYIDDIVEAIHCAFKNNSSPNIVYNIGNGIPISIKKLTYKIIDIIGHGKPIFKKSVENEILDNQYPDISKFINDFDWKPKTSLDDGLKLTIKFYKEY